VENSLTESIFNVCKILNEHLVEYLIVGGSAVALHGFYRQSHDSAGQLMKKPDLDLWYNPTYDNYFKLLNALQALGQDVSELKQEASPDPKRSFFKFEEEKYKLDLLPEIIGLSKFRTSFDNGILTKIRDLEIRYLSYDDLMRSKTALSRGKDVEDIEQLKLRRGIQE
jgi:hypothetical protein